MGSRQQEMDPRRSAWPGVSRWHDRIYMGVLRRSREAEPSGDTVEGSRPSDRPAKRMGRVARVHLDTRPAAEVATSLLRDEEGRPDEVGADVDSQSGSPPVWVRLPPPACRLPRGATCPAEAVGRAVTIRPRPASCILMGVSRPTQRGSPPCVCCVFRRFWPSRSASRRVAVVRQCQPLRQRPIARWGRGHRRQPAGGSAPQRIPAGPRWECPWVPWAWGCPAVRWGT